MPFIIKPKTILIIEALKQGRKQIDIAREFNLTKQRICQIACQYHIDTIQIRQEIKFKNTQKDDVLKWGDKNTSDLYKVQRRKFTTKRCQSKHTGYEWTIQFGQIYWPAHCPILGLELNYFAESRMENSVSFDRTNNKKGYIPGNVKIISWRANRIKNDGTSEEHYKIAEYLDTLDFIEQCSSSMSKETSV